MGRRGWVTRMESVAGEKKEWSDLRERARLFILSSSNSSRNVLEVEPAMIRRAASSRARAASASNAPGVTDYVVAQPGTGRIEQQPTQPTGTSRGYARSRLSDRRRLPCQQAFREIFNK